MNDNLNVMYNIICVLLLLFIINVLSIKLKKIFSSEFYEIKSC